MEQLNSFKQELIELRNRLNSMINELESEGVSVKQYSEITGHSAHKIRRWCRNGRLKASKTGRNWKINQDQADPDRK